MLSLSEVALLREADRKIDARNPHDLLQKHVIAALGYFIFGVLWIAFSDTLSRTLFLDPNRLYEVSLWKGWAFVGGTTIMAFVYFASRLRYSPR